MAAPELTVLQGVFRQRYDFGGAQGSENVLRKAWLNNIAKAFLDIEYGLGSKNNRRDKNFWRLRIAGILLGKSFERCRELMYSYNSKPFLATDAIPPMNWGQFFDCISCLGLGPELTEIVLEMDHAVQEFIFNNMKNWVTERPIYSSHYVLLISSSICVHLHQSLGKDVESVMDQIKSLLESLLKHPEDLQWKWQPSEVECQMSMLARLQSELSDTKQNLKERDVEVPNVFYYSKLPHLLSAATVQSIQGIRCESNAQDLLDSMMLLKRTSQNSSNSPRQTHTSDDCIQLTRTFLKFAARKTEDTNAIPEKLLNLLDAIEHLTKDAQSGQIPSENLVHKDERKLFVIAHRLQGYEKAVESLLTEMVHDPAQHESWKEVFICLSNNTECIAVKNCILLILKGVQNCVMFSEKDENNRQNYIASALSFQRLFWNVFYLLQLTDKVSVTESIISRRDLSLLLSEYPLKRFESDSQKLSEFSQSQRRKIKLIFDGLMKETSIKDSIVEKFCEALLTSPEATIQKVIEHVLRSSQQAGVMRDLTVKFQSLFDFGRPESEISLFWEIFCKLSASNWDRNEVSSVGNGLNFISDLLESNHPSSIEISAKLVMEIFNTVTLSLRESKMESRGLVHKAERSIPLKLALKTLASVVALPVFFDAIPNVKVLALCFSMAGDIERSIHFWNSNEKFDEELYEMLLGNLDFLVSKSAERLDSLTESDKSLLKWIQNVVPSFNWTVQLSFLPLVKNIDGFQLSVPSCLSDVCSIPTFFKPCEELSYGAGTGLLVWHQCFIANPSLCPLSSLDLDNLTPEGIRLFSNGWIVTMSQVLPYCIPSQWCTLVEASKILISDYKLYIPIAPKSVMSLPIIDIKEVYSLLGVVQLLTQAFELLSKSCCVHWTSTCMWSHMSKCYCFVLSSLIGNSAEFDRACRDAQLFVLSQVFCSICHLAALLDDLPYEKQSNHASGSLFILSLDVITSFEKIFNEVRNPENTPEDDKSEGSESAVSIGSENSLYPERSYERTMLEISGRLQEMLHSVTLVANDENRKTLNQKLLNLVEATKE